MTKNPFRYGGDLGVNELVDRTDETAKVVSTILNGEKLFLIGPRRFGKTSILRSVEETMTAKSAIIIRLNAENYTNLSTLAEKIVTETASKLKGKVDFVIELLRKFFSKLRPEVNFDITEQKWSASFGVKVSSEADHDLKMLIDALDGLEKLAAAQKKSRPIGLIIDEFQAVVARGGVQAEAQFRSVIQEHSRVGYVFAGSQTRLMTDMTMKHERPLYRLGANIFIGPLPRAEFAAHLRRSFQRTGFTIADENAIDAILDAAEEVPYNVQMLAHNCWEELNASRTQKSARLSTEMVKNVLERTVQGLDPLFTRMWTQLTTIQQKTLIAVINKNGVGLTASAVVRTIGASPSTVHTALKALYDQELLRDEPAGGVVCVRFEDPFFAQWIRLTVMR